VQAKLFGSARKISPVITAKKALSQGSKADDLFTFESRFNNIGKSIKPLKISILGLREIKLPLRPEQRMIFQG
jgi:hypothetical protein